MFIPLVDLKSQYLSIQQEIDEAIRAVIEDCVFIKGRFVEEFEQAFADKCHVDHCLGVASGTDAIYIILRALGIGSGDGVITPAYSWISTSETVVQAGAKPIFVDIDPDFYTIDSTKIEECITSKTKAIIAVHLYGQPADMDAIREICEAHDLYLIEDCAQAHFAEYKGKNVGTFGIAGTFSFYPGKNLGAYGDAGAIITNNSELAEKARRIANHGALVKHDHEIDGINSRLDGIQASILTTKLKFIRQWNDKRAEHSLMYNELLKDVHGITTPKIHPDVSHIFHLYVIRTPRRNGLQQYLKQSGIQTAIHYPTALPFLPVYRELGHAPEDFPISFAYESEILSLPMYPELTEDQIQFVCDKIKSFLHSSVR